MDTTKARSYYLRQLLGSSQSDIHPERWLVTQADSDLELWWTTHAVQTPIDTVIAESFTDAASLLRDKHWL
jgi:hypothetical protein